VLGLTSSIVTNETRKKMEAEERSKFHSRNVVLSLDTKFSNKNSMGIDFDNDNEYLDMQLDFTLQVVQLKRLESSL
jgi:hypothetical protein